VWNQAAQMSLKDEAAFKAFMGQVGGIIRAGIGVSRPFR